jgi:hypothetical protein
VHVDQGLLSWAVFDWENIFDFQVMLQPIENKKEVLTCLQTHLNRYNEEFGNIYLDIMLSDNIVNHLVKMHRVISYHHR